MESFVVFTVGVAFAVGIYVGMRLERRRRRGVVIDVGRHAFAVGDRVVEQPIRVIHVADLPYDRERES